jgi:LysR family transcriptional regulator, nitrogen assimilation regulatory protein
MEVSQLRTMIHVAELGSLSKAADRLGVAQPALSRQIRLLEEELRTPLFIRHGRGMVLTEMGRRILDPANEIMSSLDTIYQVAEEGKTSLTGRVRFGMTPTVSEIMTVSLARMVSHAHPQLSLCFVSGFSGHLLDWLKREELDCCVSYDPEPGGAVRTHPILLESLLLVGSSERGLKLTEEFRFGELERESLVLPSPLHGLRRNVDACAMRAGINLSPAIEADSLGAMIDLVMGGFGCTILPLAPIYDRIAKGELTAAPLVDPAPSRRVVLAYPADRPTSPATRFTGDMFASIATQMVNAGVWAGRILTD